MGIREVVGLILFVAAATMFSFGYWIHRGWYLGALAVAGVGGLLFLSSRVSRRLSNVSPLPDHLDAPYVPSHLRGFPGSKIRDGHDIELDIDGDGK